MEGQQVRAEPPEQLDAPQLGVGRAQSLASCVPGDQGRPHWLPGLIVGEKGS